LVIINAIYPHRSSQAYRRQNRRLHGFGPWLRVRVLVVGLAFQWKGKPGSGWAGAKSMNQDSGKDSPRRPTDFLWLGFDIGQSQTPKMPIQRFRPPKPVQIRALD
jgi:hypothetical protein